VAKGATVYVCDRCGAESPQWRGRCPECGAWGSLSEFHPGPARSEPLQSLPPVSLLDVPLEADARLATGLVEFDRVLGGGAVPGAVVLVAGDPGIGKSTLLLQAANAWASTGRSCLYVSGEESPRQVRWRSARLEAISPALSLLAETTLEAVETHLESAGPAVVIVDSIQTMHLSSVPAAPGTVSQIRECALRLTRWAKAREVPMFLVGHVTKEGAIAGPRVLEHMVDTVLYLEGESHTSYRLLRAVKNRFGSTHELGIFEMTDQGMQGVADPSEALLSGRRPGVTGSAVAATMEGSRPLLVEVQALVTPAPPFGAPRRATTGVDHRRACLMLAVLEKRARLALGSQDVFLNVPGGVQLGEPAADLAMAVALASSFGDRPVRENTIFVGEVGLTGELRGVPNLERRIREAARLGFDRAVIPAGSSRRAPDGMTVVPVGEVTAACREGLASEGPRKPASRNREQAGESRV